MILCFNVRLHFIRASPPVVLAITSLQLNSRCEASEKWHNSVLKCVVNSEKRVEGDSAKPFFLFVSFKLKKTARAARNTAVVWTLCFCFNMLTHHDTSGCSEWTQNQNPCGLTCEGFSQEIKENQVWVFCHGEFLQQRSQEGLIEVFRNALLLTLTDSLGERWVRPKSQLEL